MAERAMWRFPMPADLENTQVWATESKEPADAREISKRPIISKEIQACLNPASPGFGLQFLQNRDRSLCGREEGVHTEGACFIWDDRHEALAEIWRTQQVFE